ncbi:hypothetical protein T190115A13A_120079 [Tenacibaculum sp. 190524A02b]|uniref:Uncharacterized protein n=1 Tax=Tenacibaculum vairaonense TaxID=3137860 RepID=A0ABM9PHK9_9FLAO
MACKPVVGICACATLVTNKHKKNSFLIMTFRFTFKILFSYDKKSRMLPDSTYFTSECTFLFSECTFILINPLNILFLF